MNSNFIENDDFVEKLGARVTEEIVRMDRQVDLNAQTPQIGRAGGDAAKHYFSNAPIAKPPHKTGRTKIVLIDEFSLTRDCLVQAFHSNGGDLLVTAFETVDECFEQHHDRIDVLMVYSHTERGLSASALGAVARCVELVPDARVVMLSDATEEAQPAAVAAAVKAGAKGFIPTRKIDMQLVSATIRFVLAGGTVAPIHLMASQGETQEPAAAPAPEPAQPGHELDPLQGRFTERQMMVFGLLRQGKANKIIAHELQMSQSTVKVHIRNIMRKMGATNRTQAVYKTEMIAPANPAARQAASHRG